MSRTGSHEAYTLRCSHTDKGVVCNKVILNSPPRTDRPRAIRWGLCYDHTPRLKWNYRNAPAKQELS